MERLLQQFQDRASAGSIWLSHRGEYRRGIMIDSSNNPPDGPQILNRRQELFRFFVLAFGIWPIVAVGVVGGYGFLVWMYQIIAGPPGPLGH
ncbi:periplasmic nitrate reductase, NapE protein [Pseudooceanicola nitratireducens]|jgi:nitrate reductase NapE|uniref:periplasmic nitrate reductase, NapE protein n=1 Tax=Pseudooceanicola nitratireducens TaxID=517719 RepID=UPI001FCD2193|nr:periplasmic nitrate reductase, NapE protein [Pseudooceanicola nitratireducens]